MIKDLLPIGSVVILKDGKKKLMVFGVKQSDAENELVEYDYIGVLYPEGNMGPEFQYLFNHDDINSIFFRGFEDTERQEFITKLSEVYKD